MKKLAALVILAIGGGAVAAANDITIDFESLVGMTNAVNSPIPADSRLSNQFQSSLGILFRGGSPFIAVVTLGANHAVSGTRGIGSSSPDGRLTYSAPNPIDFSFWNPLSVTQAAATNLFSVRGDLVGAGGTMTLTAFDLDGNVLNSVSLVDTGGNLMQVSSPTKNIHRVRFVGTGTVALDDVKFNTVQPVGQILNQAVTLEDHVEPNQPVTVIIRSLSGTVLRTIPTTLVNGGYSVAHTLQSDTYVVEVYGLTWLRKRTTVTLTGSTVTAPAVSLANGDCNTSNIIDIADYAILAAAFDATPTSGNWQLRADLNGDLIVDIADYSILARNFDRVGD